MFYYPEKRRKQRKEGKRKKNGRRQPRVGPPGFDLPDLKKLPNTKFNCDETQRFVNDIGSPQTVFSKAIRTGESFLPPEK